MARPRRGTPRCAPWSRRDPRRGRSDRCPAPPRARRRARRSAPRAPRRSSSRQVSSWSPVRTSTGHRDVSHLGLEHRHVELARDADAEHRVGLPHPAALDLAGAVPGEVQRPLGRQARVVAVRGTPPSPRATPTGDAGAGGRGRCGRTTAGSPSGIWSGGTSAACGRTEAVDVHDPAHQLREGAGHTGGLAATEGVGHEADRSPAEVADQQREVEVEQRPREPGVERAAVAVARGSRRRPRGSRGPRRAARGRRTSGRGRRRRAGTARAGRPGRPSPTSARWCGRGRRAPPARAPGCCTL